MAARTVGDALGVNPVDDAELTRSAEVLRALLDRFLGGQPEPAARSAFLARLEEHLDRSPRELPVVTERWAAYEHVDVQLALESWLTERGLSWQVIGTAHHARRHRTLAEMLDFSRHDPSWSVSQPDWVHLPVSVDATHPCVSFGVFLVDTADPLVVLMRGPDPQVGHDGVSLEVLCADADLVTGLVADLRDLAVELSPVRGQVVTLAPADRPGGSPISFLRRPALTREQLVLPDGTLNAVERQVVGIAQLKPRLLASGQHLKRGVLLYGPPGTGKTHTVRYLLSQLQDTTAVVLSGSALHAVASACTLARRHQPAVVVLEDVDLIAADRSFSPSGSNPLLFEILNQIDGLGDDVDVVFLLTTNRVDILERALSQRPGRIDESVEIGPPDAAGREQLLRLYGASVGLAALDIATAVERTDGLTATFLRELVRRSVVTAALARPDEDPVTVTAPGLDIAVEELLRSRAVLAGALDGDGEAGPPAFVPGPGVTHFRAFGRRTAFVADNSPQVDDPVVPPGWDDE